MYHFCWDDVDLKLVMSGAGDIRTHHTSKERGVVFVFFFPFAVTDKICYSRRIQSKISKGKKGVGGDGVQREPGAGFQESSPRRVMQDTYHSSSN